MYNISRQNIRKYNLTEPLYIAKKIGTKEDEYGNEVVIYDEPKKYFFNIMPVSTSSDVRTFGERAIAMKVAVIREKDAYINEFKEFDVAYLDGETPEGEYENGFNANYRIYAVQPQNAILKIYFSKLIKNNRKD